MQNSLRAVIFRIMVFYHKRIQIKVSQGKRCIRHGSSSCPLPVVLGTGLLFLVMMCDIHTEYCQSAQHTQASVSGVFVGACHMGTVDSYVTNLSLQPLWRLSRYHVTQIPPSSITLLDYLK